MNDEREGDHGDGTLALVSSRGNKRREGWRPRGEEGVIGDVHSTDFGHIVLSAFLLLQGGGFLEEDEAVAAFHVLMRCDAVRGQVVGSVSEDIVRSKMQMDPSCEKCRSPPCPRGSAP